MLHEQVFFNLLSLCVFAALREIVLLVPEIFSLFQSGREGGISTRDLRYPNPAP